MRMFTNNAFYKAIPGYHLHVVNPTPETSSNPWLRIQGLQPINFALTPFKWLNYDVYGLINYA